jgi:hypothetical protein
VLKLLLIKGIASNHCQSLTFSCLTCAYSIGLTWSFKSGNPCLNLLIPSWTLNTRVKLVLALIAAFLLAMLLEYTSVIRRIVVAKTRRTRVGSTQGGMNNRFYMYRSLLALLHGMFQLNDNSMDKVLPYGSIHTPYFASHSLIY